MKAHTAKLIGISLLAHIVAAVCIIYAASEPKKSPPRMQPIKIVVAPPVKAPPKVEPPPKPIEKKESVKPPEKKPIKKEVVKPKSERKPDKAPTPNAKPIQGLAPSAVSPNGSGIAVPVGNTLLAKDEGIRLKPQDVKEMEQDLSAEASLIRSTFVKPKYTNQAIFAQLQGVFTIDVFVDKEGNPTDVDIPHAVGYDMDAPIKQAILGAKFIPKKDKTGQPLDGWTEIKVKLEIP